MLFADIEAGAVVASVVVSNTATALATAAVMLLKFRADARRQARKDSIDEWRELLAESRDHVRKLEEQSERKDKVIDQYQQVIASLTDEHADCREETAALRLAVDSLYDWLVKVWPTEKGVPPEMPKIPRREQRPVRSDYLLRQAEQSALLVKQTDEAIKPKVPNAEPSR